MGVLYRGLLLGLMVAAPVGPIGLLCIRRTIQKGLLVGFLTGVGAACADTVFAAVAALGVEAIVDFIQEYSAIIRGVGGILLLVVAIHTWRDKPKPPAEDQARVGSLIGAPISGFIITLTNPLTLFAVMAVVATFSNLQQSHDSETMISGFFIGSLSWWAFLSGGVALMRNFFTETRILYINRFTAVALAGLAAMAIGSGIAAFL